VGAALDYFLRMIIGAHVPQEDPLVHAKEVAADAVQLFVGPPQSWKKPPPREDAEELKASDLPVYVHAPYLINVASPNNRIRIPSRKILTNTLERAEEVGAEAVIVHAGHAEDDISKGFYRWRKALEEVESPVQILIENTAGGENAMARRIDILDGLWQEVGDMGVGFCFDTCHAHAAGEELSDVVERVLKATGRIDLVHANDSRDKPGTGADRHANFADGKIDDDHIVAMVKAAGAPAVICETPWPKIADDLAWLRERL
jgi:deoxyribonuclease IV